jgi:hypothetical protein
MDRTGDARGGVQFYNFHRRGVPSKRILGRN